MLTADLVRSRRRGETLKIISIPNKSRELVLAAADQLVEITKANIGVSREVMRAEWASVDVPSNLRKVLDGLIKLIDDRCTFKMIDGVEPIALRRAVFEAASTARAEVSHGESFDRDQVLTTIAAEYELTVETLESSLYADLKTAHRLKSFDALLGTRLIDAYELAQEQAVLLRATRLTVWVQCAEPAAYRVLFRKLKFRRLLHTIHKETKGYRIEIDGPHSLFKSVTKYGLQLALVLPAIRACTTWSLTADIRWGKERVPLTFKTDGKATADPDGKAVRLSDEVATLIKRFRMLKTKWKVQRSRRILDLPGVGLCIPDLVFTHTESKAKVYLEVMGYWSRDAVWKRIELVEAGLKDRIIFAVSRRLRVSEAALADDVPGELYVYKGVMSAGRIAERLGP